ncbi:hypothetical protein [Nonomuraea typhae]|uniref:hypothetical protein n=1 Tax=Nonomuraea typhae TaxID=2603600 RepID=UPI0012F7CD57|nr:hypothetical protein [Nonomuraea typhae]
MDLFLIGRKRKEVSREDVVTALATVSVFQNYVQHADAKAGIVVVVHAAGAALLAAQSGVAPRMLAGSPAVGWPILVVFAAGFLGAGYHLARAVSPSRSFIRSRFGISGVPETAPDHTDLATQYEEAWAMVTTLAAIARVKHLHVTRAVRWSCVMILSITAWSAAILLV